MDTKNIKLDKVKNFYSFGKSFEKIFYSFNKKKKIFFEILYITIAINFYHKLSAIIIFNLTKIFGYKFYVKNKILRLLFFTSIRGMSFKKILNIRKNYFKNLVNGDKKIEDEKIKNIINEIRIRGYCDITNLVKIQEEDIKKVKTYFKSQKLYNGHDPLQSNLKKYDTNEIYNNNEKHQIFNNGYFSYSAETSLNNEVLNNLFFNKSLKQLSDLYCGFDTEPYALATMLNIKKETSHPVTKFHRDIDDFISLGFFIFWTKTDRNNGATTYKVGSHIDESSSGPDEFLEVEAGSIIAGDWIGLHKGNHKMIDRERLITMIRFGNKINHSYFQTKSFYFF